MSDLNNLYYDLSLIHVYIEVWLECFISFVRIQKSLYLTKPKCDWQTCPWLNCQQQVLQKEFPGPSWRICRMFVMIYFTQIIRYIEINPSKNALITSSADRYSNIT